LTTSSGNGGEHGVESRSIDTLILTYDRATDVLEVGGHCNSLDLMLDILSRATRVLESRWRQQELQRIMQERADAAQAAAIAASLRKGA